MKTIIILFSIAGFAFTSTCLGQTLSPDNKDLLFYSAQYNQASNRIEHQVNQYPARTSSGDYFEAPLLNLTYFVPVKFDMNMEAWMESPFESNLYEEDLKIEAWMESPFESSVYEKDIPIEAWMESPFESSFYEPDFSIELWMTRPFESGEDIEVEDWMTAPF